MKPVAPQAVVGQSLPPPPLALPLAPPPTAGQRGWGRGSLCLHRLGPPRARCFPGTLVPSSARRAPRPVHPASAGLWTYGGLARVSVRGEDAGCWCGAY